LRYRDLVVYDRSPNVRMLRLSVFGCLLIGFFITVAALQSFGGALLSARSPECLLALCLVWVLVALGLTAFGAAAPEPQHRWRTAQLRLHVGRSRTRCRHRAHLDQRGR
jgi:hypothetical protein